MPPRYRFTKDEMIDEGFELVRKSGMSALTARSLATALSSSPKVIFGSFSGMEEVRELVVERARSLYSKRMTEALKRRDILPYRSCGLCFVEFAHTEKELFKLLFMRDPTGITPETDDDTLEPIYSVIMKGLNVDRETAVTMHGKYSIFAYGLACMATNQVTPLDIEETDRLLSENWEDLVRRYRSNE